MRNPWARLMLTFVIIVFGVSGAIANEQTMFLGEPFEPEVVKTAIERKGVHEVLDVISNNATLYSQLRNHIRQGDRRWLMLFVLLREHPEAEHGSMFDLDLAYALESNPVRALEAMNAYQQKNADYFSQNDFPPYAKLVCGNVDQDWELGCATTAAPGSVDSDAVRTLDYRIEKLKHVSNPDVDTVRKLCLEQVEKTRAFWLKLCK